MFKKLFLAFLICLFSVGITNAEWKTDLVGTLDNKGRKIVKVWHNKYDSLLVIFYDQNSDGKLDKLHHVHFMGRCMGDKTVGIDTSIKTVDDLIKYFVNREKKQIKIHKEMIRKESLKNTI